MQCALTTVPSATSGTLSSPPPRLSALGDPCFPGTSTPPYTITFSCLDGFLCCEKTLKFNVFTLVFFVCLFHLPEKIQQKLLLREMSEILLPLFSPKVFIVLGGIFKSLIHFQFILMYGIRRQTSFIFLHVIVQFSQHHLLIKLSLPIVCPCLFCQILIDHKKVCLFLGFLSCSIDLYTSFYASTMLF